tara:strand:+ start:642 stop:1637 length:996 start_codon:yes stop_codon:yes gene_type:complete
MRYNPKGEDHRPTIEEYLEATGHQEEYESYKMSTYAWNPLEEDKKLRITKSSLGTFGWCPQQYYLEKFKGLRGEQRYYHDRGLNVHDMVEYFWDTFNKMDEALECIDNGDEFTAKQMLYDAVKMPTDKYAYGEEEQIAQWLDWQFERLKLTKGKGWYPAKVEANIHAMRYVEIDGVGIPIHMNGFIDTIFDTTEGGYALMELKTGKWKDNKVSNMRAEMAFYRMMLEHSNHHEYLPITHWGWEFPGGHIEGGEGNKIFYEEIKPRTMKSVENKLKKLVKAHVEMDFPPTPFLGRTKLKCEWCDYQEHCDFWNLTEEELDDLLEGIEWTKKE